MTCTDDDLNQLKKWIDRVPERALTMPRADLIKALITRLEAAEATMKSGFPCSGSCGLDGQLWQRWREAAGQ